MKTDNKHPDPITFSSWTELPPATMALATTEWNETGTWRYMRPRYVERVPACQYSCPTSCDIEAWIRLMESGKIEDAWDAATIENPFPAIMGRVCFHPCQDGCNRKELGGAVSIKMLERVLGDIAQSEMPPPKPFFPSSGKEIVVIGAGPAGLACAYHLSRLGHRVKVFERNPKAGGMLRYGIPQYRLPQDVLDREIGRLEKMGISFQLGKPMRDVTQLQQMRRDFAAVFLATGAQRSRLLGIQQEKSAGVIAGLEFLRRTAEGRPPSIGRRVLVIGGGNTAIDTARVAKRFGSEAIIIYRRSRAEMPAFEEEVCEAEKEGVVIQTLLSPTRILTGNGKATGVECQRMELGDPDESGRRQPRPIEGELTSFEADTIITAIGEEIDSSIIPASLAIDKGRIRTRPDGRTEWQNVFAGGDLISQPRTVVDALASGKMSAIAIDCQIRGEKAEDVFDHIRVPDSNALLMSRYINLRTGRPMCSATTSEPEHQTKVVRFSDLNPVYFSESKPNGYPVRETQERFAGGGFAEVYMAPSREVRSSEMVRCFHCGRCTECDNCYIYCPDVAITKKEGGFEIDYYYCKGCGICPTECPRSAMEMIEEPTS